MPLTYLLFDQVLFSRITYRAPLGFFDLLGGVLFIMAIAGLAIGSQTLKIAKTNPATVLRNE